MPFSRRSRCSACCSCRPSSRCTCSGCGATRRVVPSTLLWQRLVADVEANAPWQRLRRSLLLLLQLLLVAVLVLLAARPFLERPAGLAGDIVVVIDTSASMGATDIPPDRLTAAQGAASTRSATCRPAATSASSRRAGLPGSSSTATTDLGRVRPAIEAIRPTPSTGDLADALNLATRSRPGRATPRSSWRRTPRSRSPDGAARPQVRVLRVGRERQQPGDRRAGGPDRALGGDAIGVREHREPRHRAGPAAARDLRRRPASSRRGTSGPRCPAERAE